ncbi:Succinate dehydrogenase cytochrome b556 subunit [Candidatus Bealeia paramacronuclearis]|uniref:Succinate dehydrogenase cytochrome b556 subunit n=1 Tax=Candidatus Bealeia paramacronuclearis TaxID=1921001 RepID=A0ABZ2C9E4_9PROT|nr:Succinate dehydrogenase cytochrome b556 subunit [Candidatus Bealeia paramacronuclearis]
MTSQPEKRDMPLSPHLQIYKPQMTSILSILHRGTGVVLYFGTLLFVLWLTLLSSGPESYACAKSWLKSPIGYLFLMGWSFSLFYHLANGIRHLAWDLGHGYDLKTAENSGKIVIICAISFSVFSWALGFVWGKIWS